MEKPAEVFAPEGWIEATAMEQFWSAVRLDTVVAAALMPDAHTGYSLPIGAVMMTEEYVYPSWVGYDIGCGMLAVELPDIRVGEVRRNAREIYERIANAVPMGFGSHQHSEPLPAGIAVGGVPPAIRDVWGEKAGFQIGTLGGGNHFIEIGGLDGHGEDSPAWVVVHSGSRGVGHRIASHYMALAAGPDRRPEGHYGLSTRRPEGLEYLDAVRAASHFAEHNRRRIAIEAWKQMAWVCGGTMSYAPSRVYDCTHNQVAGRPSIGLMLHRKGATAAPDGAHVVIPGNMRDGTVLGVGLGNPRGLASCSHGAGRRLGRNEARRQLSVESFHATMAGITGTVGPETIDESPDAYKSIGEVMRYQADLVTQTGMIVPVINLKSRDGGRGKRRKSDGEG